MENPPSAGPSAASLRWAILRQALISRSSSSDPDNISRTRMKSVSRKAARGFNLIPCHALNGQAVEETFPSWKVEELDGHRDAYMCYTLPLGRTPRLVLIQRVENHVDLDDFEVCSKFNIDNTGIICHWPAEDVLAYFCLTHAEVFRSKRVLELGSGYGLAGLTIAVGTDASEVVISDGNPQVVDYIQRSIHTNSANFGHTKVKPMILHWSEEPVSNMLNTFDIIIASDCTFFREFHESLAATVKSLLKDSDRSEALFFNPKRGDSLDKFLEKIVKIGLQFEVIEKYDTNIWEQHLKFQSGDDSSWPNYDTDHSYPLLVRITF